MSWRLTPKEAGLIIIDLQEKLIPILHEKEKVIQFADGRIFSGRKAKELGLVDELGGMEKAVEIAATEAKMKEEPKVIYPSKNKYKFLDELAEGKVSLPSIFKMEYRLP